MNVDEVRAILNSAEALKAQIVIKEEQLVVLKAAMQRLSADASLTTPTPSCDLRWKEPITARIDALQAQIETDKAALAAAQQRVNATIALVSSPIEQEVLTMLYCARLQWKQIAAAMSYSKSHAYRLHRHALEEIAQQL